MTAPVLLTVSGAIPDGLVADVATGRRPRVDYLELQRVTGGELLDLGAALDATGRVGRVLARLLGAGPVVALAAHRRRRELAVVWSDGEHVGIPFAALDRASRIGRHSRRSAVTPHHAMVAHVVSTPSKRLALRLLGRCADLVVVYATAQRRFAIERLGWTADALLLTPFAVDTAFFHPHGPPPVTPGGRATICAAGLERRDYATLVAAVRGLDVEVVIAAASPWSRRRDRSDGLTLPSNVCVRRLDLAELRDLYERSAAVVVPLEETDFQAGITTILEAMSMARPVITTRTTGQTDTIVDGVTGRYVPPGDADALRDAIVDVLADPDAAHRMGSAARCWAVEHADIEDYASRLGDRLLELAGAPTGSVS